MKVILKQDVKKLGEKGAVVNVSDGYAKNFLFRRKLASPLTESSKKELETEKKQKAKKNKRLLEHAEAEAAKLAEITFKIKAKAGEEGKLFGSITSQDISSAVEEQSEYKISKKDIILKDHIKHLGKYSVEAKIHTSIKAQINFEVVGE